MHTRHKQGVHICIRAGPRPTPNQTKPDTIYVVRRTSHQPPSWCRNPRACCSSANEAGAAVGAYCCCCLAAAIARCRLLATSGTRPSPRRSMLPVNKQGVCVDQFSVDEKTTPVASGEKGAQVSAHASPMMLCMHGCAVAIDGGAIQPQEPSISAGRHHGGPASIVDLNSPESTGWTQCMAALLNEQTCVPSKT